MEEGFKEDTGDKEDMGWCGDGCRYRRLEPRILVRGRLTRGFTQTTEVDAVAVVR